MGFRSGHITFSVAPLNTGHCSQGAPRSAYRSNAPTSKEAGGEEILLLSYSYIWRVGEPRVLSKGYVEGKKKQEL